MQSKFEINSLRKKRLVEMLKILFSEYDIIKINKKSGVIIFKNKFLCFSTTKQRIHISELCIDELPKRLGKYRRGNVSSYIQTVNNYLEYIINDNVCNIIDFLYQEYSNIKSSSKVDILLEDAQQSLPESNSDSITIGTIIKQVSRKSEIKDLIKLINKFTKEPVKEQYRRSLFFTRKLYNVD